ncbi:MAG: SpoIIE family protein phosphatase, partial [Leptospiraceae bacterium]|nr:SpoIIE family protein phosphatase [Leptospiraceae bacterium]
RILGAMFVVYTVFNGSYFVSSSFYSELAAFHRWSTVFFVFQAIVILTVFLFYFPVPKKTKIAKVIAIIWTVASLIMSGYFFYATWSSNTIYHFEGHYWDFDADDASYIVSIMILLGTIMMVSAGIWRIFVADKGTRLGMVFVMLGVVSAAILPGALNTLSRDGAIDRGLFQTIFALGTVIGFFLIVVVWINLTKDKTSFMIKIIGISMVTFLLVLQGINYFFFIDQEVSYDQIQNLKTRRFIESQIKAEDMEYVSIYNIDKNEYSFSYKKNPDLVLNTHLIQNELMNTYLIEQIANLTYAEDRMDQFNTLLEAVPASFVGYKKSIQNFYDDNPTVSNEEILAHLDSLKRTVKFRGSKIKKMKDANFRALLEKFLDKSYGSFNPFRDAMIAHLKTSKSEGKELKTEIMGFIDAARPAGTRHYRSSPNKEQVTHFVSYIIPDIQNRLIYEAGFNYLAYRTFIQPTAYKLGFMLLFVLVIVLLGFRIFFLKALTRPLDELLSGVQKVNEGDLTVQVPIHVEDEIGYLAHHFNSMVNSIKDAKQKLQEYAETLEEKVEERTAELQKTLEEVQELKSQQDGDYFLTSLLTTPLGGNHAKSETVHIDFLVKQKKTFSFRKWNREIGGDICISNTINLRGRPHTVFLNADAMGKSMQGAGGILVLGAVFSSLVERVKLSSDEQQKFPERWLKNSFTELHRIFESFDGSMLISLVLGLIDDENGFMYYINAEHPWTVLYRDGNASFIEKELTFRKLGTQGLSGTLSVATFQLEPGDVLFVGSDGRDDILISMNEDGSRLINEDETLFLKIVEEAEGDLSEIKKSLYKRGELTDDLSLLRLGYREHILESPEGERDHRMLEFMQMGRQAMKRGDTDEAIKYLESAYEIQTDHPELLKDLVKVYLKIKNYKKAAGFVEDYVYLRPGDTDLVYIASYCFKMIGDFQKAIDFGERVRLRDPHMIRNLKNLADVYHLDQKSGRARAIVEMGLKTEPEDASLLKMLDKIGQAGDSEETVS